MAAPELCLIDGKEIKTMIYKGTGFCCIDCMKKAGRDVSSVGTIMFVTFEEYELIKEKRKQDVSG